MNLKTVWTEEMVLLTTLKMTQFKEVFNFIDQRYAQNFPDSVAYQAKVVTGRQKLEDLTSRRTVPPAPETK